MYSDPLLIHLAGNCSSKNVRTILQSVVELHLAGKLFHHGVEAQHTVCNTSRYMFAVTVFSAHLIFFLWGFVKDQVYRTPVRDLADLQERIYAAVNNVTPQMLHNTWVEVEYQLDISYAFKNSYF